MTKYIPPHLRNTEKNKNTEKQVISELDTKEKPNYIGKTNDIQQELHRLAQEFANNYKPLMKRDIVEIMNNENDNNDNNDNQISFTMMQFNILADGLSGAHTPLNPIFKHCDDECLQFNYRGFRLIEEIIRFKPDIITIQEVDQIDFFKHYLSPFGYIGIHTTKPSSPCCRIGKTVNKELLPDGSAVFWNSNIFQQVNNYQFGQNVDKNAPQNIRNMVASVVHLRHKKNKNKELMMVSTHLKAHFSMESDIKRLNQINYLMPNLAKLCEDKNNIPLFIGTDFNSTPETMGSFFPYSYQSVVNGKYLLNELNKFINKQQENEEEDNKDDKELNNGQRCIKKYNFGDDDDMAQKVVNLLKKNGYEYEYGLQLKSAYCFGQYKGKKLGNNPYFTCTLGGMRCLDFILFQPHKNIEVTHLLSIPDVLQIYTPRWDYPSDHFSLMATFKV